MPRGLRGPARAPVSRPGLFRRVTVLLAPPPTRYARERPPAGGSALDGPALAEQIAGLGRFEPCFPEHRHGVFSEERRGAAHWPGPLRCS